MARARTVVSRLAHRSARTTRRSPVQGPTLAPRDVKGGINGAARSCLPGEDVARPLFLESRQGRFVGEPLLQALPMQLKVTAHDHRVVGTSTSRTSAAGTPWRSVARARSRTSRKAPDSRRCPRYVSAESVPRTLGARTLKSQGVTITTRPFPKASVVAYSVPSGATSTAAGSVTSTSTDASPSMIWEI
jgi:hypothetical protein